MRYVGYFLICAGFLVGAYAAVETLEAINLNGYMIGIVACIVGIAMVRISLHSESREEGRMASNIESLGGCLQRIADNSAKLNDEKESIDVYDLRHRIDEIFVEDIQTFADARESIAHRHGLNAYAELMSHFASGERHMNRVWSASTDGYVDEARDYIGKAAEQFRETQEVFARLEA